MKQILVLNDKVKSIVELIADNILSNKEEIKKDWLKWFETFRKDSYNHDVLPYFQIVTKNETNLAYQTGRKFSKEMFIDLDVEQKVSERDQKPYIVITLMVQAYEASLLDSSWHDVLYSAKTYIKFE